MQFSRLANDYLRHLTSVKGCSARTEECYGDAYQGFLTYVTGTLGAQDSVRAFTPDAVEAWMTALLTEGRKRSTVAMKLACLSSLGKWAKTRKDERGRYVLAENPVERIERPRKDRAVKTYLTADEVRAMFRVDCHPGERLVLAALAETQARASELVNATVGDLQIEGDRVVLRITRKGGHAELVRLSAPTSAALLAMLTQREAEPGDPVFVNTAGSAYRRSALYELVARLATRAGIRRIKVGPHLFARHTMASLAAQDGASVPAIAAMLGHADLSTTRHYVHGVTADAVRDRVRLLWNEETRT